MTQMQDRGDVEYPQSDIELAYENAGGESWDDLLQYLESDPSEDFEALSAESLATMTQQVRSMMEADEDYPASAEELRQLLEGREAA